MKILVAEDDMISRKLLTTILEQMSHRVEAYEDGVAAWAAFEKEPTPIMVVDWLMPNMDGLALTRKIRGKHEIGLRFDVHRILPPGVFRVEIEPL